MAVVVRMPSVLAGASEASVSAWLVAPGDVVAVGTPLAEIETEKAVVEYAAEDAGVVGRLVVAAGETAEVGSPIAVLVTDGEGDADIDAALGASGAPGGVPREGGGAEAPAARGRIFASPIARKTARERGIDLASVTGTGPNGRIVRRDIDHLAGQPAESARSAPEAPAEKILASNQYPSTGSTPRSSAPATAMRRAIARRLTESKATVPHFYMATECVVDELLSLRERINETAAVKVSVNDFVVTAAAAAFGDVPEANVTWSSDGLITHGNVDISIAVATEGGLVTPVLRDVGSKKLSQVAREAADLAERARDRRLRQEEIEGGVFSVSNLGMYGTLEFSAIINPPQSGILAVGAAREQPVARDGAVSVATVMRCTLSVDHRAIDGALAARWLAAFTYRIEHPLAAIA
ncbi:MAG: 2-oxo acid dehydrogenase subunit E2 [Nocardiopsaceae bacterium]|nr:2-oxo acid dehydrogenase subunit E2 [Nocardiopsaceae bacterium]